MIYSPYLSQKLQEGINNLQNNNCNIRRMARTSQQRRQYVKISKNQKQALLHLVFQNGIKIKEASLKLNLKYAAAKTFVLQFRKKLIKKDFHYASDQPCQVCPKRKQTVTFKIISQVGGKEIGSKTYIYN